MRITNNLLIHNMLWNMNNNLISMDQKQKQLATGKRVQKVSDDPVGVTKIIKVKSDIVENEQYKNNTRDAKSWLDLSENSLMDVKEILQRVRELAVQGANDTNTPEDTDKIAKEIDQLTEEIIVNANSTMAGRYLFSGFNTDKKLLNEDGSFNVDVTFEKILEFESIAYEVAVGEEIDVGVNYLDVFGMVPADNVMVDTFKFGTPRYEGVQAAPATHTNIQGAFDYTADLSSVATPVTVTVGGVVYEVDKTELNGSLSQGEFIDVLKNAEQISPAPSTPIPTLGEVMEIYSVGSSDPTNTMGELVMEVKAFGNVAVSLGAGFSGGYSPPEVITLGTAASPAVLTGTENITNALTTDGVKGTGKQSFIVTYNGRSEKIEIDMDTVGSVSAMVTAVNAELDAKFDPGNVVMAATDGGPVTFTGAVGPDGSRAELKIDVVASYKSQLVQDLQDFSTALTSKDNASIQKFLGEADVHLDQTVAKLAEIGAMNNRLNFIENRIDDNTLALTEILTKVQDIDYAEVTIQFKSLESIYSASLSVGAKVIQPTLVDFIK